MATTLICQPSSEDTNQYLVIAVRIFAVVGFSYLLRILYQVTTWSLSSPRFTPNEDDPAAEENIGIDPHEATLANPSLELDFDIYDGGDLGIRMPEPAYHPRGRH